ncbi:MAG: hypothetical protein AVDCRST_MAG74-3231 [uncultured Pyrinomonadaceae bacterium]|uniref:Uncharacterized protein n=1 Tax=uncultured Pyrinomonadaceae bacterium TaxID=2283094 RepID=A0A6J4Q023_9BACT|nr:MAG: hypothetical protein AVDCRST_MAG74-3231 [uncultured Pyrinomonadaceae bacterium]
MRLNSSPTIEFAASAEYRYNFPKTNVEQNYQTCRQSFWRRI